MRARDTMRVLTLTSVMAVMVIGCNSQGGPSAPPDLASQAAESATAESVICDFFAAAGPHDDVVEAATSGIRDENPAVATRRAIDGIEAIAERASGDEKEDLLALANAMNDASMAGEGYVGWNPAYESFYVKYAEQCGEEIAD